jgi:diguanylate cyclase (GGDEF)-like protein
MLQLGLLIVMESRRRNARTGNERYFILMLLIAMFSFIADIISSFSSAPDWFFPLVAASVYAEILLSTALLPIYYRYICTQIIGLDAKLKRNTYLVLLVLTLLCTATVVSTAFHGQIFYFDSDHVYHRGPLLFVPMSMQFIMMLIIEGFLISQRRKIEVNYYRSLMLFLVAPLIGWVLQLFIFGLPFSLLGITFAALILFTNIQNRNNDKDYLTGAFTRQMLDSYMQHKIDASTNQRSFSAILLDIDDFKSINDRFGHFEGDIALRNAVRVLRDSVGYSDLVARYGGDEFCIVLESDDFRVVEDTICRINSNLSDFNRSENKPYRLSFSLGYSVYHVSLGSTAESFFRVIDQKMYEQKNSRKV